MSVNAVVFSKNRAMQLDACLRSIEKFAPYAGRIVVIYRATTREFEAAYQSLELGGRVVLVEETSDFRRNVIEAVSSGGAGYTVFHTDDDVFFRQPRAVPAFSDEFAAFSFRLGRNTTYSYPYGRAQPVPTHSLVGPTIVWDWTRADGDFAYPMSVDGHIFRTQLLLQLLADARFANPNELEDELHLRRHRAPRWMVASEESSLVSIPLNVVTSARANRAGGDPALSADALNARFLAGERIDLERLDFSSVCAAHQEIPIAFEQTRSGR